MDLSTKNMHYWVLIREPVWLPAVSRNVAPGEFFGCVKIKEMASMKAENQWALNSLEQREAIKSKLALGERLVEPSKHTGIFLLFYCAPLVDDVSMEPGFQKILQKLLWKPCQSHDYHLSVPSWMQANLVKILLAKELIDDLKNSDVCMTVRLQIVYGKLSVLFVHSAFEESVGNRLQKFAGSDSSDNKELLQRFTSFFKDEYMIPRGSTIDLSRELGNMVHTIVDGKEVGSIQSNFLGWSILDLYIGDNPFDRKAKEERAKPGFSISAVDISFFKTYRIMSNEKLPFALSIEEFYLAS
ncbi:uncharacterized protein LOC131327472 [Rhododendron vialii]|uniref:uncharacterized protein LOC131327472 n=1 Tax=Rhododendron vialii TaxID=182163 RepID=UPI00265EDA9C|nr:uncharacterized protein LOC131327472 [Rhododendron vialii]